MVGLDEEEHIFTINPVKKGCIFDGGNKTVVWFLKHISQQGKIKRIERKIHHTTLRVALSFYSNDKIASFSKESSSHAAVCALYELSSNFTVDPKLQTKKHECESKVLCCLKNRNQSIPFQTSYLLVRAA